MLYDAAFAFASTDSAVAESVHAELQRLARLQGKPALRVFREVPRLEAVPAIWPAIRDALEAAPLLVVLQSQASVETSSVQRTIDYWLDNRDPSTLIILRLDNAVAPDHGPSTVAGHKRATNPTPTSVTLDLTAGPAEIVARMLGVPVATVLAPDLSRRRRRRWLAAVAALIALNAMALLIYRATRSETTTPTALPPDADTADVQLLAAAKRASAAGRSHVSRWLLASVSTPTDEWRVEASKPLGVAPRRVFFDERPAGILHLELSPDGKHLLMASGHEFAWLLPATGHGTPLQLVGHTQSIGASAFDPTSTRLVTASMDHTARVWDVATGALLATHQHLGAVASVAMFHAGTRFVTGAADGDARIFSLVDLTAPPIVLVHPVVRMDRKEPIEVVDVSRDDTLVLTASYFRGNVSVWPARGSRKPASVLANDRYITSARFLSDGHSVLVTFDDQRIDCCEAAEVFALDGRRLQALAGDDTFSATLVEPGVILLTGERSVKVWNRGAAVPTAQFELPWPGPMVAFASTTSLLVSGGNSHLVARFTAEPERTYSLANHAGTIVSLVISHDGAWIVSGAIDHTAMMWATADLGREEAVLTTATDEELRVRLRRDIEPCLPPDDRESYLREPRATALARWRGCELACWGRTFAAGLEVDTTVPCVR